MIKYKEKKTTSEKPISLAPLISKRLLTHCWKWSQNPKRKKKHKKKIQKKNPRRLTARYKTAQLNAKSRLTGQDFAEQRRHFEDWTSLFCYLLLSIQVARLPVKNNINITHRTECGVIETLLLEKRNQNLGDRKENPNMAKHGTKTSYRSAITGRYVTKKTTIRHPKTTVKETGKVKTTRKSK